MRWFIVIASRHVFSETMNFDCRVEVRVLARDKQSAMLKVRTEFRHYHLQVL